MTTPGQTNRWVGAARLLVILIVVLWLVEILDTVALDSSLQQYGIRPRTAIGLWGVLAAPFLHGTFGHLITNTIPLVVLGGFLLLRGGRVWAVVSALVVVMGGAATWLLGRSAIHIGASGVIFGYLGFLLAVGFFERSGRAIAVGVLVGLLYGGLLWGVLPSGATAGVSWEGHLFGLVAGVAAARLVAGEKEPVTA